MYFSQARKQHAYKEWYLTCKATFLQSKQPDISPKLGLFTLLCCQFKKKIRKKKKVMKIQVRLMAATHSFLHSASGTWTLDLGFRISHKKDAWHLSFIYPVSLFPSLSWMPKAKQNLNIEIKRQQYFEGIYFSLIMIGEYFSWREQHHNLCQEELAVNLRKREAEKQTREGCLCMWKSMCTEASGTKWHKLFLSTGDLCVVDLYRSVRSVLHTSLYLSRLLITDARSDYSWLRRTQCGNFFGNTC